MRELREIEKNPTKPRAESRPEPEHEIDPEVIRKNQSAFLQEVGCFAYPDMTQLMITFDFGDVMLTGHAYEAQGDAWMKLTGSITFHKEN